MRLLIKWVVCLSLASCVSVQAASALPPSTPPKYSSPVIFIPGIMGSRLERNGKILWGDSIWTMRDTFDQLALRPDLTDDGIRPNGVLTELRVVGGLIKISQYSTILKVLRNAGLQDDKTLFTFAYDWRRSSAENAKKLATSVTEWRKTFRNPNIKFRIVAHSMGGLVARYYISQLGGDKFVDRLILLGTPNYGSLKSVMMFRGGLLDDEINLLLGEARVRRVLRSFPSSYELLPRVMACCEEVNGSIRQTIRLFSLEPWQRYRWIEFDASEDAALGWAFVKGQLESAQNFHHALQRKPFPIDVHKVAGFTTATIEKIQVEPSGRVTTFMGQGDGTVTLESARTADPVAQDGLLNLQLVAEKHGSVYDDRFAKATILDLLRDQRPSTVEERYSTSQEAKDALAQADVTLDKAYYRPGANLLVAVDVRDSNKTPIATDSIQFVLAGKPIAVDSVPGPIPTFRIKAPTQPGTYDLVLTINVKKAVLQTTEIFEVTTP